ncbi:hypothetical protein TNCV_1345601 [Trichonephila clavipes]|nr:hypothetical protein TNCV_1345601 [Trichonephila clavipes]
MNKIRKTPAGLDCPIVLSEEFIAVGDDDNVCTIPIIAHKDILNLVRSSKDIDADSDNENEMNNSNPLLPNHPK